MKSTREYKQDISEIRNTYYVHAIKTEGMITF
jgi:hypothetical protein